MRHARMVLVSLLVLGCQEPLGPGDGLRGHFTDGASQLDASGSKVVLTGRCERAEFDPIVLDAQSGFDVTSVVFTRTGLVTPVPERLRMQGHLAGRQLVLTLAVVSSGSLPSFPTIVTLVPGSHDPPICNY
jgi:hypothetical protein